MYAALQRGGMGRGRDRCSASSTLIVDRRRFRYGCQSGSGDGEKEADKGEGESWAEEWPVEDVCEGDRSDGRGEEEIERRDKDKALEDVGG